MNILIYTQWSTYLNYSVGGAETSLRILAEKLAKEGHRIIYLTEEKGGRLFYQRSEKINGVVVHIINLPNLPTLGIGWLLKIRRWLIEFYFCLVAEKLIRKNDIQLIHTYHEVPGMYRFLKLKEKKKLTYSTVLRCAGKFWVKDIKENPAQKNKYQYVFNTVDSINFLTGGLKQLFEEACNEMKLEVCSRDYLIHDIGLDYARIEEKWSPRESGPFKIVMASRFSSHQKRQDILVKALLKLPDDFPVQLILIGNGSERKNIEQLIIEKKLEDKITVIPFLQQKELWKLMISCHLYVHACDFEGLGKIILEAMAIGLPILVSDVTPLNDYIIDGKNGFLSKNEPALWAEKIKKIYLERKELHNISTAAKATIEAHYLADVNVKKYESYFEGVLNETTKGTED